MSSARYLALRRWEKPMVMSSARYLALQKMWETYDDVISSVSGLTEDVRNLCWCHQLAIWPYEDGRNLWWCHQLGIWPYRRCEKPMMMSSARWLQKMWETYADVISSLSGLTEDVRNLWWCHQLAIWPYRRCEKPMMMSSARYLALQKMRNLWWCHQLAIWPYRRCEKPMMMSSARLSGLTEDGRNLWRCHQLAIWPYRRCEKRIMLSSARYLALQKKWETYDDAISSLSGLTEDVRNLWWCHQLAIWPYRRCEKPMMMSSARYLALRKMWETYDDVISSLSGLTEAVRNLWWCHQLAIWTYRRCEKPMMMSSACYLALQRMWETYDDVISSLSGLTKMWETYGDVISSVSGLTEDVRNLWWCHQLGIWPYRRCEKPMMMSSARYLALQKMGETYDDSSVGLTEDVRNLWWCHQLAIWPYRDVRNLWWSIQNDDVISSLLQKMWETYDDVISSPYRRCVMISSLSGLWWCHQLAIWPYRRCEKPMMMSSARYLALQKMWETNDDDINSLSRLTEDVRNLWWCHQLAIWPNRSCEKPMMMSSARYLDLQKMWETYDDVISLLSGLTEDVRNLWWCHQLAIWPYRRCEKPMMMTSTRYLDLQKMWETYDDVISSLSGLTEAVRNLWWCHQLAIWTYRRCEKPMMMSSACYLAYRGCEKPMMMSSARYLALRRWEKPMVMSSARYLALQKMWETYDDVISSVSGLTEDVRNLCWCHQLAIWPYEDVRNLWWCHQLGIWPYRRCEKPMMMSSARYLTLQKMWETYADVISSLSGLTEMWETYDDVISSLSGLTEDVRNLCWWSARYLALQKMWETYDDVSSARYLALQKMWETYDDVTARYLTLQKM